MKIRLRHQRLASHLAQSRLSQNRWAQKLGLHKGHLSRLTNGQRPYPGPETRRKLIQGLGLPFDQLFEIEGSAPPGRLRRLTRKIRRQVLGRTPSLAFGWSAEIRQSLRALRRQPSFGILALATIALGVGANTAIFTLVNGVLLQPLPFQEPDRLVYLWSVRHEGTTFGRISYQDYLDIERSVESLQAVAAVNADDVTWVGDGGAERVAVEMVTAPFFAVLGIPPAQGRPMLTTESELESSAAVAVISHDFWQAKLGAAQKAIGSSLRLNGQPHEIVGIMPPGFRGLEGRAQIWLPLTRMDSIHPDLKQYNLLQSRGTRFLMVIGRQRARAGEAALQDQLESLAGHLAAEFPRTNEDKQLVAESLDEVLRGDVHTPVLWLMGAVALLLLIAVVNLAHLSLARSAQRVREVAIRKALGAELPRMVRQLLTESLLLAVAGGVVGLVIARLALDSMLALLPAGLPGYVVPSLDGGVVLFAVVLSLLVGIVFGLAPTLLAVRKGPADALRRNAGSVVGGARRSTMTSALVVAEVALSLTLLAGSAWMLQGLSKAVAFDPGYEATGLITARIDLPAYKFSADEQERILGAVVERVGALPGVEEASLSSHLFFGGGYMTGEVSRADDLDQTEIRTQMMWVSPGFFRTLGVGLHGGRNFTNTDRSEAPRVAIISRRFAEEAWPGSDPVGQFLRTGRSAETTTLVIGVVDDVRTRRGGAPAPNQLYFPLAQGGLWSRALMVRTDSVEMVLASLRAAIQQVDSEIPIFQVESMESLVSRTFASTRLLALLMTLFAVAALLLATVGVYGVMAFTVAQARTEVGIRLALGARPDDVVRQYLGYGGRRALAGAVVGLVLSFGLGGLFGARLPDVESLDPAVVAAVTFLLLAAALAASWLPAWRASRADPLETVRAE